MNFPGGARGVGSPPQVQTVRNILTVFRITQCSVSVSPVPMHIWKEVRAYWQVEKERKT